MYLNELSPAEGAKTSAKRKGRGPASGNGKTAGKGHKGQKARSGGGVRPGFEGGQMPLQRRLPKRGFNNIFAKEYVVLKISDLNGFDARKFIDIDAVIEAGYASKKLDGLKIISGGELEKAVKVRCTKITAGAKATIEAAGGKVEVI
ncbi:MAG: 50S ribosomal protein L15 [Clostridia bacterium]|nr:50S ribosomal protein L15 [Clostridia bacterium]